MELSYTKRDLPPAARAFYERLANGEFCIRRCEECDRVSFPPNESCPACGSDAYRLESHSGAGTLHAFTTQERGFRFTAPDVLGVVQLDQGAGFAFGVIKAAYEECAIGDALTLDPVVVEDGWTLPAWTLGPHE